MSKQMVIPFILIGSGAAILLVMKMRETSAKRLGFFFFFSNPTLFWNHRRKG